MLLAKILGHINAPGFSELFNHQINYVEPLKHVRLDRTADEK
jgi:hypothetical protein